jgi:deoxyribose-phosphate aldolase
VKTLTRAELAGLLEQTLAAPEATNEAVQRLCASASELGIRGVCVNGSRVELAYALLEETNVKVTALVGYPFGAADSDVKRYETEVAIDHGAHEIETVLNVGRLKDDDRRYVLRELLDIVEAADERPVKLVLEGGLLTAEEKLVACELVLEAGVHCVCTGSGLRFPAAAPEVAELRNALGPKFGIKASGGIADVQMASALASAGATRLGTTDAAALLSRLAAELPPAAGK